MGSVDFFNTMSGIGEGAGAVGSLINAFTANSRMKKQYKYQRKLNEQQQEFASRNASVAFDRQYQLTRDMPALQKAGLTRAGISTAGINGQGASAATVQQASPASGGSAPDDMVGPALTGFSQSMYGLAGLAQKTKLSDSQSKLLDVEREGKSIDNLSKSIKNEIEIGQGLANKSLTEEQAAALRRQNKLFDSTFESEVEIKYQEAVQAGIETKIKEQDLEYKKLQVQGQDLANKLDEQQLNKLLFEVEHQAELFQTQLDLLNSQILSNKAMSADSYASAALKNAQAYGQRLQNRLEKEKVPYAKQLANMYVKTVVNRAAVEYEAAVKSRELSKQEKFRTEHQSSDRTWDLALRTASVAGDIIGTCVGCYTGVRAVGAAGQVAGSLSNFSNSSSGGRIIQPNVYGNGRGSFYGPDGMPIRQGQ